MNARRKKQANRKILFHIVTLLAATFLAGCYSAGRNVSKFDKFSNITINSIDGNGIAPDRMTEFGQLYLTPSQVVSNDLKIYTLHIHLDISTPGLGPGPAIVDQRQPLILLVDGNRVDFEYFAGFNIQTPVTYRASEDKLRKIGDAKTVELKWYHSAGYTERKLQPANIENFRRFVAQFIDGQPVAKK
jgi:hypothetical protein